MKRFIAVLVGLVLLPAIASAKPSEGFYGSLGIGYSALTGVELKGVEDTRAGTPPYTDVDVDADHGQTVQAAFGYASPVERGRVVAVRFELQHAYAANDVKSVSVDSSSGPDALSDGRIVTNALMLNMLFEAQRVGVMTPVFGIGAGWSHFDVDDIAGVDGADYAPAAQVVLGLAAEISSRFKLEFRYRGRRQGDVRIEDDSASTSGGDYLVDVETGTAHALTGTATLRF